MTATDAFIDVFVAPGRSGLGNSPRPTFIDFGPDGNLYVSTYRSAGGQHGKGVFRYDGTTGARIDKFVRTGSGGLDGAAGFAFGPDGNLYLASHLTNQILRYNGTTGAYVDTFAFGGGLTNPARLLFANVVPEPSAFIGLLSMGALAFMAYVWQRHSQVVLEITEDDLAGGAGECEK